MALFRRHGTTIRSGTKREPRGNVVRLRRFWPASYATLKESVWICAGRNLSGRLRILPTRTLNYARPVRTAIVAAVIAAAILVAACYHGPVVTTTTAAPQPTTTTQLPATTRPATTTTTMGPTTTTTMRTTTTMWSNNGTTTTWVSPFPTLPIPPFPPTPRYNSNQYGCHSDGRCLDDWGVWCDDGEWVEADGEEMCLETAEGL